MTIRKNRAFTVTFAAIDPAARPARASGVSFAAGECKISKDGAGFSNTSNLPAEIGSTGRYSLALTAAEMNADYIHVYVEDGAGAMDPVDLVFATGGQPSGTVAADGSNSATSFKTNLSEATDDYWKDALFLFTSGNLIGQLKKISAYNGTTKFITLSTAFTAAPSASDCFVLINI